MITSGPYVEVLHEILGPRKSPDGTTTLFTYPLGEGALPLIHLDDFAKYVGIITSRPTEFAGQDLHVASFHASGSDIAETFVKVNGRSAKYVDIPLAAWLNAAFGYQPRGVDLPIAREMYPTDISAEKERFLLPLSWGQNFSAWWNVYRNSGRNQGIVQRDYVMLDAVLPERVKTLEEWMRKVSYDGERKEVLKQLNDRLAERGGKN